MFVIKDSQKKLFGSWSIDEQKPVWAKNIDEALEYDSFCDAVIDCDLFNENGVVVEVANVN